MEFKHLEEVLNRYGKELVERYKKGLLDHNSNASGTLANSVQYILEKDGNAYEVSLSLLSYYRFIEQGRRPGGKFPPLDRIAEWIRIKPVIPRAYDGKLPTEKQLAYLISRKIAVEGIEPKPILKEAREDVDGQMMESIVDALAEDISSQVDEALVILKRF